MKRDSDLSNMGGFFSGHISCEKRCDFRIVHHRGFGVLLRSKVVCLSFDETLKMKIARRIFALE